MNPRLRIVIADDERPARSFLAALLRSFDDVVIVAEAESGKDAVAAIERERPVALLDLQMPELDGLDVVRILKKADVPLVAFVTAYDEYAVRAFEVKCRRLSAQTRRPIATARDAQPSAGAHRTFRDRVRASGTGERCHQSVRIVGHTTVSGADSGSAPRRGRHSPRRPYRLGCR